jgi:flavin-dependent dehydrogenase
MHDVVIVGARVAGSATAMLLARLGHDVVVVDQASLPSDTVSTHSIARSGVVQLRRWGLLDEVLDSGAPAIRQVTFHAGGTSVRRTVKDKSGVDLVVAPRRYLLDTILACAALRAGADVRDGVTVTGVRRDGRGRVVGVNGHDRAGAHGQACIWVCTPAAEARAVRRGTGSRAEAFGELLRRSAPELAERLRHARRTSPVQGMLRQPNQLRQAAGPGWALVGDAGYHRDAVTAYGISDAFHHAELLATALATRPIPGRRLLATA